MRVLFALMISAVIFLAGCGNASENAKNGEGLADSLNLSGTLKIAGSATLYPMMVKWAEVFTKDHPKVKFDVKSGHSEDGLRALLNGKADVAMMSRVPSDTLAEKGLWYTAVAVDAIVAVISFENSEIQPLVMHGMNKEALVKVFTGKTQTWGQISGRPCKEAVNAYSFSDSAGTAVVWSQFLGLETSAVKATRVNNAAEMISHLTSEKGAIGYCSIMDAYDLTTGFRKNGLYIVPIDYNASGTIEDEEQYYDKFSLVSNAAVTGKMPAPPARELYLVTKGKPKDLLTKEFLKWVLTIGQNYAPARGYINITPQAANAAIESMN